MNTADRPEAGSARGRKITRLLPRLIASLLLLVPMILVPYLELNATHLLNPEWPAHARMHEAWQLATNAGIAVLAFGWTWTRDGLARGSALGAIVSAGFVVAWLMRDLYGGAMAGTTTAAYSLLGLDAALVVMAGAATAFLAILVLEMRFKAIPATASRTADSYALRTHVCPGRIVCESKAENSRPSDHFDTQGTS